MTHLIRRFALASTGLFLCLQAPAMAQQDQSFEDWMTGFRAELSADGVSSEILTSMFDGLEPNNTVIDRDSSQPEFVRPVWSYLNIAAGDVRRDNGRAAAANILSVLEAVEERHQVDADVLTAIWGLESAYGEILGNMDVVQSLATLAWEGRRRSWAEGELRAVATMIERGYARREDLRGSWAGAMGQTQFIPSTYLERAVDFDGDGRRDIWANEGDALGSAANLLARAGWEFEAPTAIEVTLPADFDYVSWGERTRKPVSDWAMDGVRPNSGEWSADDLYRRARIILPAGAQGPAFMAFSNFDAIMRYNNSTSYALGVSYLAKRINSDLGLPTGWPESNTPLTRSEARQLQSALTNAGYSTQGIDGIFGRNSRAALKRYQADHGLTPDGYPGRIVFEQIMGSNG